MARVFDEAGKLGKATDLINRGYGTVEDFLLNAEPYHNDIVTNPPFKLAQKFIEHALYKIDTGRKVCMFLKLLFLEGKARKELFTISPPLKPFMFQVVV